jgi:hypothetical protein
LTWGRSISAERQELHGADELLCFSRSGQEFELFEAQPYGERLGHKDDAGEVHTCMLAAAGLDDQIVVGGDEHPAEGGCTVEQIRVGELMRPVLEGGENIEPAEPEPVNHRLVDVVVEVEPNRRGQIWPRALSLATMGDSPISARRLSTYASRRARSASIAWRWSQ